MKKAAAVVAAMLALALIALGGWYWGIPRTTPGAPETILVGEKPYESSALIYIAQAQGMFGQNGLQVTIKPFDSAPNAMNGLLNNEADVVLTSEYVVIGKAFAKENIRVVGSIDKYQTTYLVGRKDRGIENVPDLKGKKIGVTRGGSGEFYLGRFLSLHGVSLQEVILVDMLPTQYVPALANGDVDALITGIYIDKIQDQLGNRVVLWPAQNSQDSFWVMTTRRDWAESHPETIRRLLQSLAQAEDLSTDQPNQARAIVQKRLNLSDAYMAAVWPDHRFLVSLDQSLIVALEGEARWMIQNNLTPEKQIPNFLDYISFKGLEAVNPDAVNIIR